MAGFFGCLGLGFKGCVELGGDEKWAEEGFYAFDIGVKEWSRGGSSWSCGNIGKEPCALGSFLVCC